MSDVVVSNNTELSRYEAHVDGRLAGFAEYHLRASSIVFTHTEVADEFEGHGIGGALVRTSLEEIRAAGLYDVVPICPFYQSWIEKHPDFAELVHSSTGATAEGEA
jgi:predicted GNAT family acetyltransferase